MLLSVVESFWKLNIAKDYCSCLVFFVEEVGKEASDGGQRGCKAMV